MEGDHTPNPKRFQVYTQIPNGKGFRIKDSKYIYMFDKYGGWYDEYNNYYNQDGQHEQPPSDEDEDFQRTVLEDEFEEDDYDDYYEKQYGAHLHQDDLYQEELHRAPHPHQKILEAIAHNTANLHDYPLKTPLRVDFDNMSLKISKEQILKHYRSKVGKGILNAILTKEDGKFIGQGYIVCDNVSTAEKLIKYEGEQFKGHPVYFDVQSVQSFLIDPVTKEETGITINQDDFQPLVKETPKIQQTKEQPKGGKKKYITKNKADSNIQKTKEKKQPLKLQTKQQTSSPVKKTKQEQIQLKPQQPTWAKYKGQVTIFPKKTSFKDWMHKLGYNQNQHFKNPQKVEQNDPTKRIATVELRSDVYERIEKQLYEGHKVHFEKIN